MTYKCIDQLWSVRSEKADILEDINLMVDLGPLKDGVSHTEHTTLRSTVSEIKVERNEAMVNKSRSLQLHISKHENNVCKQL